MLVDKVVTGELRSTLLAREELDVEVSCTHGVLREGVRLLQTCIGRDVDGDRVQMSFLVFLIAEETLEALVAVNAEICLGRTGRRSFFSIQTSTTTLPVFHCEGKIRVGDTLEMDRTVTSGDISYSRQECVVPSFYRTLLVIPKKVSKI